MVKDVVLIADWLRPESGPLCWLEPLSAAQRDEITAFDIPHFSLDPTRVLAVHGKISVKAVDFGSLLPHGWIKSAVSL